MLGKEVRAGGHWSEALLSGSGSGVPEVPLTQEGRDPSKTFRSATVAGTAQETWNGLNAKTRRSEAGGRPRKLT